MKIVCDICPCDVEMKLKERLSNYKRAGRTFRRRRFICPVCNYEKLVIAGGEGDEKLIPERGIAVVKAIAKKESENRDY